jgi:hypothetical protein
LKRVADLLEHFATRWERTREDPEAQRELVKLIVERVHIDGEAVVAMTLRSIYNLVLGYNANGPTEFTVDPFSYADGSDGGQVSLWHTHWLREHLWASFFLVNPIDLRLPEVESDSCSIE